MSKIDKSMIGRLVEIEWKNPDDDWPWFTVVEVKARRGFVKLKGADYPDGKGRHQGDSFWAPLDDVLRVRVAA